MIANLGREDELLNAERFDRLLRQAHDAELVEVRKVGEDMYDVAPLGQTSAPPSRYERKPQPASRPAEGEASSPAAKPPAAVDVPPPPAAPRSLGIRRGSRVGMVKTAIPLVGVISLDGETPSRREVEPVKVDEVVKAPSNGRGRGRASKPEVALAGDAAPVKKPARRRGGRGRGKPKTDA
jgi:hypothetical protein